MDALKIALTEIPIHFIASAIYYKLGCVELAMNNHEAARAQAPTRNRYIRHTKTLKDFGVNVIMGPADAHFGSVEACAG
jgi:hypothetical protein